MRVSIFTNVRSANVAKAEDRRLLRVLFLRIGRLSAVQDSATAVISQAYSFLIRPDGRPGILRYEELLRDDRHQLTDRDAPEEELTMPN